MKSRRDRGVEEVDDEPSPLRTRPAWRRASSAAREGAPPQGTDGFDMNALVHPRTGEFLAATLTIAEAAGILGMPERTIRQLAHDGLLPAMARRGTRGQYRIITARLLDELGLRGERRAS